MPGPVLFASHPPVTTFYPFLAVCGGELKLSEGVIESPNYPDYYRPSKDCVWRISVEEGHKVACEFTAFEVRILGLEVGVGLSSGRKKGLKSAVWVTGDCKLFLIFIYFVVFAMRENILQWNYFLFP